MLPNDMYFAALGVGSSGPRNPYLAAVDDVRPTPSAPRRGPRRLVGRALIGLGELIAAEAHGAGATRASR